MKTRQAGRAGPRTAAADAPFHRRDRLMAPNGAVGALPILRRAPQRTSAVGVPLPCLHALAQDAQTAQPEKQPHHPELHGPACATMAATTPNHTPLSPRATENVITQGKSPVR